MIFGFHEKGLQSNRAIELPIVLDFHKELRRAPFIKQRVSWEGTHE